MTSVKLQFFKRNGAIVALSIALGACSTAVNAADRQSAPGSNEQSTGQAVGLLFSSMDLNGDHGTTKAEVMRGIAYQWALIDPTRSGRVGTMIVDNWGNSAFGYKDQPTALISFDSNIDGTITADEFGIRLMSEFLKLDSNDDGVLARQEMRALDYAPDPFEKEQELTNSDHPFSQVRGFNR